MGPALYQFLRILIAVASRLYFRLHVEGRENVPAEGPFVLAPVHRSNLDFALASTVTRRQLRYMAKASIWKFKLLGRIISSMDAYPVERGTADREALIRTIDVLKAGHGTVLFPEGTRRSGPVVEDLFEGACYVAARAGAPVVPVGIGGSERAMGRGVRWPRPRKVAIVVGPAIPPPVPPEGRSRVARAAIRDATQALEKELQRLFDEAQIRAGQGDPARS
jgi:1-acyl-sn-glycerol-3-phosphate acyltransferase